MILKYNINEKRFEGFIPYEAMKFYSCIIIQVWENEINMWNQQLEQAKTVKKNEIICNICLQPPESTYVFLECGHLPFCEQCTNIIMKSKYPKCPTCRQHVTRRVRAFLQQPQIFLTKWLQKTLIRFVFYFLVYLIDLFDKIINALFLSISLKISLIQGRPIINQRRKGISFFIL